MCMPVSRGQNNVIKKAGEKKKEKKPTQQKIWLCIIEEIHFSNKKLSAVSLVLFIS